MSWSAELPASAVGKCAALAAVYAIAALGGLSLDAVGGVAAMVWPASGIALAALLLYGYRLWPGIACGALVANLVTGVPALAAVAIAVGNTSEAVLAVYLLRRCGFRNRLDRLRDVFSLVVAAALLSTLVAASIGVTSAWLSGHVASPDFAFAWVSWWIGDAVGVLIVTPLLLVWRAPPSLREHAAWYAELGAVLALQALFGAFLAGFHGPALWIVYPFVVWAALRCAQPGTTAAVLVASCISLWMAVNHLGPFTAIDLRPGLMSLQLCLGVLSFTGIALAAADSQRRQAEEATRDGEQRFHALIDRSQDAIVLLDARGMIVYASPSSVRAHGERVEVNRLAIDLVHPDERDELAALLVDLGQKPGHSMTAEFRLWHRDGSWHWAEGTGTNLLADPRVRAIVINYRDVTAHKRGVAALSRTRGELELRVQERIALFEGAPTGIVISDVDGRIVSTNAQIENMFGYERQALIGQPVEMLLPVGLRAAHAGHRDGYAAKPMMRAMGAGRDLSAVRKDGTEFAVEVGLSPIRTENGLLIAAHLTDVSARRAAEAAVRAARDELERRVEERTLQLQDANEALHRLSSRLLSLQDEERRRIGRELHEGTAQTLACIGMNLGLVQDAAEHLRPAAQRALSESTRLVEQCVRELRTLSYFMHPPLLDDIGLVPALRWYAEGFTSRSGIAVKVDAPPALGRLTQEIETALFRIVQESLVNVQQHNRSKGVRIELTHLEDAVTLSIEERRPRSAAAEAPELDAGLAEAELQAGVGILSMRERVRLLGGQLDIISRDTETVMRTRLPLNGSSGAARHSVPRSVVA